MLLGQVHRFIQEIESLHLVERVNIWLALDGLGLQINFNLV